MSEDAIKILAEIRQTFEKMEERKMRVVNIDHLHKEVVRCVQAIKDKRDNISYLNQRRDFPLKREEIFDFCNHIGRSLNNLDSIFHHLSYNSSIDELFDMDKIRQMKIQAVSEALTEDEENEITSLLMSLKFILLERNKLTVKEQRKIVGLKKRIKNLQSKIIEVLKYEDLHIFESNYQSNNLLRDADSALNFNQRIKSEFKPEEAKLYRLNPDHQCPS